MIKILVAEENKKHNVQYRKYLANDKGFEVIGTNSGLCTLKKYHEVKPDILILNSNFSDMSYKEIIDRISIDLNEKYKHNIIMIANNEKEQLSIVDTFKIYKILRKPISSKTLLDVVNQICLENNFPRLYDSEIQDLLISLNFNISNGTEYLIEAIKLCYYFPYVSKSLDTTFYLVGKKYKISSEAVRSSIRTSLDRFKKYKKATVLNDPILELLEKEDSITPKYFLDICVTYLHNKKYKQ